MPKIAIHAFRDADGTVPLRKWLNEVRKKQRQKAAKCLAAIEVLAEKGDELGRPFVAHLRDGIYELRATKGRIHLRILYFIGAGGAAVLTNGCQKEGKAPSADIELAIKRKNLVTNDASKYSVVWLE